MTFPDHRTTGLIQFGLANVLAGMAVYSFYEKELLKT